MLKIFNLLWYFTTSRRINKTQQFVTRVTKVMGTPNDLIAPISHKEYKDDFLPFRERKDHHLLQLVE